MFEVIFWFTHPYDYRQDCLMLVHILARDSAGAAAALVETHGPSATIHSIVRVCEGHTHIPSQLCAAQDDLVLTRYDHLGTIEKKHLCPDCRGRILDGPPHAWFHD